MKISFGMDEILANHTCKCLMASMNITLSSNSKDLPCCIRYIRFTKYHTNDRILSAYLPNILSIRLTKIISAVNEVLRNAVKLLTRVVVLTI